MRKKSSLTLYIGPMKSGKSKGLIEYIEHLKRQRLKYVAYKPVLDTRDGNFIKSRDDLKPVQAKLFNNGKELYYSIANILELEKVDPKNKLHTVVIDEIMLCDELIFGVFDLLRENKIHLIAAGLYYNSFNQPFKLQIYNKSHVHSLTMAELAAEFDNIIEFTANCDQCGDRAEFTKRLVDIDTEVLVGDDFYEARCKECLSL